MLAPLLLLLLDGAAAQQVTAAPRAEKGVLAWALRDLQGDEFQDWAHHITAMPEFNAAAVVDALNPADSDYSVCNEALTYLDYCESQLGGAGAVATESSTEIADCVCCISQTPIGGAYSVCSTYLTDEAPPNFSATASRTCYAKSDVLWQHV